MPQQDLSVLRIDPSARRPRRGRGRTALVGGALVAVALVLAWWLVPRRAQEVRTAVAREDRGGPVEVLTASGYVTPRRRATVSAKITGQVAEVLVDEGMKVGEGQVLARLDDADARAALGAATADRQVATARVAELEVRLVDARRTLGRIEKLYADRVASQDQLDAARTAADALAAQIAVGHDQVTAAERRVAVARRGVENTVVRAPFAGMVVSKDAQPGEMVSPISAGGGFTRTGIATIVDMESLEVEVDVNESYIARVTAGQPVEAVLDAYPEWHIPAHVRTVIPTADRQKATVKVRIAFERLDPRILPDMGVRVSFLEEAPSGKEPAGVLVPTGSVRRRDGRTFVFVVKNGAAEQRGVSTGETRMDDTLVTAGLRSGEVVVVEPPEGLENGTPVRRAE